MINGSWTLLQEKIDWRGVRLHHARQDGTRQEYLLEDLALAAPPKDRLYHEIAMGLDEVVKQSESVSHPSLRRPLGVTRHEDRYLLVRPWDPALWQGWGDEPCPPDPTVLGRWLLTMVEVLAAYHGAGLITRGIARADLVPAGTDVLVREPLCEGFLAVYRDRELCGRHDLAPEVSRGHAWGNPTDLFVLGLNAYVLATGRFPLAGSGAVLVDSLLAETIADPRSYNPVLGSALAGTILSLLSRVPAKRPDTATLITDLKNQGENGAWLAGDRESEQFARVGQRRAALLARRERIRGMLRRNRFALAGAGVAVLALVLLFGMRGRQPDPVITHNTSPAQVVAAMYRAIGTLDQALLEETLGRKAGKEIKQMVLMIYVIDRTTKAEGGRPMDAPGPLRVSGLVVTRVRQDPPEFLARYELILRKGMGESAQDEIATVEDRLTLGRVSDRRVGTKWLITGLVHKQLRMRTVNAPPEERKAQQPATPLPFVAEE